MNRRGLGVICKTIIVSRGGEVEIGWIRYSNIYIDGYIDR